MYNTYYVKSSFVKKSTYLYLDLGAKRIKTIVSLNMGHHGVDVIGACGGISIETCKPSVFITNLLSEYDGKRYTITLTYVSLFLTEI